MENVIAKILLLASLITALGTIWNMVAIFGKSSKHSISKFIEREMEPNFDKIEKSVETLSDYVKQSDVKRDKERMQSLRYECLCFASDIRKGEPKTRQEYEEIFRMETAYEELIELYKIKNGYMAEEMLFVHEQYRKLQEK